jgi:dipeptidase
MDLILLHIMPMLQISIQRYIIMLLHLVMKMARCVKFSVGSECILSRLLLCFCMNVLFLICFRVMLSYGTYLGEIPESPFTYNVAGNVNEYGLVIGESTFGGLTELAGSKRTGIVDYGSLIYLTLQRSRTAREAISVINQLVSDYGYASTGESFSIADQTELWYMELIGKGHYGQGAVWVARRVPDGYVSGHANQARITTFPLDDPENCIYSPDVISFAKDIGIYAGSDEEFSFSDIYDPVTYSGARFCEARVWSFFSTIMGEEWSNQYLDYVQGSNLSNRMPLWVKPSSKLSLEDVMNGMRNHYDGTALETTGRTFSDVGAGKSIIIALVMMYLLHFRAEARHAAIQCFLIAV